MRKTDKFLIWVCVVSLISAFYLAYRFYSLPCKNLTAPSWINGDAIPRRCVEEYRG